MMFDLHRELNKFYDQHVRLGEERKVLQKHRDTNLERLRAGLEALDYPSDFESCNQGSYAMYTINQSPSKDYDIDVAIIFDADDLPSSAYNARKRVEAAMRAGGGNFAQEPEAKTNAVRVYYQDGHHIDLAVYRKYIDQLGLEVYEHAGADWTNRRPGDITNWFSDTVNNLSPSGHGVSVATGQMRRVVRWIKKFAKSRESWNLPGGLIISVLVAENYCPNYMRDDVALYETMQAIAQRLETQVEVINPVNGDSLTTRQVDVNRLGQLKEKLDTALSNLEVLHDPNCTKQDAMGAWNTLFLDSFWTAEIDSLKAYGERLGKAAATGSAFVDPKGRVSTHPSEGAVRAPRQRFYGEE